MELGLQSRTVPIIEAQQAEASKDGIDQGDAQRQDGEPPDSWIWGLRDKEMNLFGQMSKASWVELKERPNLKGLCDKCLVFVGRSLYKTIMAYRSLENPVSGLSMKCPLCDVAFRALNFYLGQPKRALLNHFTARNRETWQIKLDYQEEWSDTQIWNRDDFMDLSCPPDIPCPWGIFPSRPIVARPGTAEGLRQILGWIRQCTGGHDCGSVSPTRLPARLVKVGSSDDDVCLEETAGAQGRYVCLSYCRRKKSQFQTTKENLEDHLVSIKGIPKTFQDAIEFTRKLGISHIWIDALCVVQDDEVEKAQQWHEMGGIFGNAFLVIAATSAGDVSSGLYSERQCYDITGITPAGDAYCFHSKRAFAKDPQPHGPLLSEGLALQERLISTRVLHMTASELIFECRRKTFGPEGEMESLGKLEYGRMVASDSLDVISCSWRDLAEKYNPMVLPDSSQKLPAISALAKQTAVLRPGSTYLAGLWSGSLPVDLLWHSALECTKRCPNLRAPSWSWAAVDGKIVHPKDISRTYIEIIEASTFPTTADLTGAVSGGYVRVRGKVLMGTTYLETQWIGSRVLRLQGKETYFFADYRGDGEAGKLFVDDEEDPCITAGKRVPVLCLQVGRGRSNRGIEGDYILVLQYVGEEKVYVRIGMVFESLGDWKTACFETGAVQDTITII